jgi:signal transduction histidine kinase
MYEIKTLFSYVNRAAQRNMAGSAHLVAVVGALVFIGFPLLYLVWTDWLPQGYDSLPLRLTASLLGLGLLLSPYWPYKLKPFLPWYWFITILFTLPFFFTYYFLMNQASDVAAMSLLCSIFLLVLLVDLFSLSLLFILGVCLAFILYYFTSPQVYFSTEHIEMGMILLFVIIAGSTVNYRTTIWQEQRMAGLAVAAGMIAHELRTPLLGIKSGAQVLTNYFPHFLEAYHLAQENGLIKDGIRESRVQQMKGVCERISNEIDYANTIIDMLLVKAGKESSLQNCVLEVCSMAECLEEALARYPFQSERQRALVSWQGDFEFLGSKLLMQHVLFNLLKNALYAIATAQKGKIMIWAEKGRNCNYLYFKDTAKGMAPKQLARLFEHFYTTTFMGTGIGLSFCKLVIKRFGGDIQCESKESEFTKFTVTFPPV